MSGKQDEDWTNSRKRKNSVDNRMNDNEGSESESGSDDHEPDQDRDHEGNADVVGSSSARTQRQRRPNSNALKTKQWREKQKLLQEKRKLDIKRLQEENLKLSRENTELRHALALMEARLRGLSVPGGVLPIGAYAYQTPTGMPPQLTDLQSLMQARNAGAVLAPPIGVSRPPEVIESGNGAAASVPGVNHTMQIDREILNILSQRANAGGGVGHNHQGSTENNPLDPSRFALGELPHDAKLQQLLNLQHQQRERVGLLGGGAGNNAASIPLNVPSLIASNAAVRMGGRPADGVLGGSHHGTAPLDNAALRLAVQREFLPQSTGNAVQSGNPLDAYRTLSAQLSEANPQLLAALGKPGFPGGAVGQMMNGQVERNPDVIREELLRLLSSRNNSAGPHSKGGT